MGQANNLFEVPEKPIVLRIYSGVSCGAIFSSLSTKIFRLLVHNKNQGIKVQGVQIYYKDCLLKPQGANKQNVSQLSSLKSI